MNKLSFTVLGCLVLISCNKVENDCSNYELKDSYSLNNLVSDTETYEKVDGVYLDSNKTNLDFFFDIGSVSSLMERSGYFERRTHFKMNFDKNMNGYFLDEKDNLSLSYQFQYLQDSVIILNTNNVYEYKFFLNDSCKLSHCVYIISTIKSVD